MSELREVAIKAIASDDGSTGISGVAAGAGADGRDPSGRRPREEGCFAAREGAREELTLAQPSLREVPDREVEVAGLSDTFLKSW